MPVMADAPLEAARAAKPAVERAFAALGDGVGVVGVGITRIGAGYGVKVNLSAAPRPDVVLPENVAGVPVRVEIVGQIRKSPLTKSPLHEREAG